MNAQNIAQVINDNRHTCGNKFQLTMNNGEKHVMRLFVSQYGTICYFPKGMRSKGYALGGLCNIAEIKPVKLQATSPEAMLLKNAAKAAGMLEKSGLWPDLLAQFKGLASLTEDEARELLELNGKANHSPWGSDEKKKAEAEYKEFYEKHGFPEYSQYHLAQLSEKGQIVSVPYDRWERDTMRTTMAQKILEASKTDGFQYHSSWYGSYDYSVSVQTDKGHPRAWYSAEYKGCGNGHYYLLLDESHALFYEND